MEYYCKYPRVWRKLFKNYIFPLKYVYSPVGSNKFLLSMSDILNIYDDLNIIIFDKLNTLHTNN